MGKRKSAAPEAAAQAPRPEPPDAVQPPQKDEDLTPYELERQALIARNRARMAELGIQLAAQELSALSHAPPKPPKAKARAAPQQAAKKSKRIRGEAVPASSLTDDALGKHDGEPGEKKPKKASRLSVAKPGDGPRHPNLPSHYDGIQSIQLTQEEMKKQEELSAIDERMAAVQLEGLVDWTDDKAVFVVKGSRGDNYLISISDEKNTCQCMDHRIRKRDCKHIKIVQSNLGLDRTPISWREAVHDKFMMTAEDRIQKGLQAIADAMGLGSVMAAPNLPKEGVHDLPGDPDKAAANEAAGGKEQEPSNQEMKKGGKGRGRGGKGKKKD